MWVSMWVHRCVCRYMSGWGMDRYMCRYVSGWGMDKGSVGHGQGQCVDIRVGGA